MEGRHERFVRPAGPGDAEIICEFNRLLAEGDRGQGLDPGGARRPACAAMLGDPASEALISSPEADGQASSGNSASPSNGATGATATSGGFRASTSPTMHAGMASFVSSMNTSCEAAAGRERHRRAALCRARQSDCPGDLSQNRDGGDGIPAHGKIPALPQRLVEKNANHESHERKKPRNPLEEIDRYDCVFSCFDFFAIS